MTKLCSVCGTENRDDAQFCRSCGTAFAGQAGRAATRDDAALNVCAECGFQNKPGLRYCANCGMSLAAADGGGAGLADANVGGSPPPLVYPTFAPVAPYPPAPHVADEPVPDIPDPDAEIALRQHEAEAHATVPTPFDEKRARRAPYVIGFFVILFIAGALFGYGYMRRSDPSPPVIGATTPPVAPTLPASTAPAAPPVIVEAPQTSPAPAAETGASAVETPPASPPAATTAGPLGTPPAAAQPLPQIGDPGATPTTEADAKRIAAERRRDRLAREKAERDAKAVGEQRDQSATAAQRAEQEAQARKRADDAQRARAATPASPQPVAAQPRGVREICAGRGAIAEAVCQSRQCGSAEHANEPLCRQLREQDERRRNFQN